MTVDTDFARNGANDPRDLRFFPADPGRSRTLSPTQVERFNRDGYVSGLPAFDEHAIAEIRTYFDGLLEAVLSADDRRNAYSINTYHLPPAEHPEKMAAFTGDFDGNPVADAN